MKFIGFFVFLYVIATALNLNSLAVAADGLFLSADQVRNELKKFEKPSTIEGDFRQTKKIKDLDISIESSGNFRIYRPSLEQISVLWRVIKPEPIKICIEQDQIQLEDLTSKKKTKLNFSEINSQGGSAFNKLIRLMTLDPEDVVKNFEVQKVSAQKFKFLPKNNKDFSFQTAGVELDVKKNLKQLSIVEVNQDSLEVQFSHAKEKPVNSKNTKALSCLE